MPSVRPARTAFLLIALLALAGCGAGGRLSAGPEPEARPTSRYLPEGARVRVRLIGGGVVTGSLLSPYRPDDDWVLLCEQASAPCAGPDAPGARRVSAASLRALHVWGRQTGYYARLGFYAGALGGLAADDDGGLLLVAGGFAGGALGAGIGSLMHGWTPVKPCRPHACGWQSEPAEETVPGGEASAPSPSVR
jgi:hypothetical protein